MGNLINRLLLFLCCQIFETIESVYRLFYGLASTKLFSEDTVREVSNRLYILVSIVILFAFAVKLIEAIVNPDLLTDSKKGVTGVLKRTIIGLMLIASVPAMFNLAYKINSEVITSSLVEKIILGKTTASSDSNNTAGVLTSSIIQGFVYPIDEEGIPITESSLCGDDADCNFAEELVSLNTSYQKYVSVIGAAPIYDEIADISVESEWPNEEKMYHFSLFILLIVSIYILYQVIILCFDAALRLVNLGILEIMAPLVIVAYMGGGTDYLSKWAKMVAEKFLSIFARIAALTFMALGLNLMFDKDSIFNNDSATFMFKLLVIIGLLRLVKDLPNIIGKIFGVNIKDPGGIKGRLGEMAGIGKMASDAWTGLGKTAKGLGKTVGIAAAAGTVGAIKKTPKVLKGLGRGAKWLDSKTGLSNKVAGKIKSTGVAKAVGTAAKKVSTTANNVKTAVKTSAERRKEKFKNEHPKLYSALSEASEYMSDKAKSTVFGGVQNIKRLPAGVKVMSAGVKSGGKYSSIKEAYEKNFGDIKYQQQLDEKRAKGVKMNSFIAKASSSGDPKFKLELNAKGKVDFNDAGNASRILTEGTQAIADNIITHSGLIGNKDSGLKKDLYDYSAKSTKLNNLQFQKESRDEMIKFVSSLGEAVTNPSDQARVVDLINRINSGSIKDINALNAEIDKMSFADKSTTSELLGNLASSGAVGSFGEEVVKVKSMFDSGLIKNETELYNALITANVDAATAQAIADAYKQTSKSNADIYKDQAKEIAKRDGALGSINSDELILDISEAQEDLEKAQKNVDERKEKLKGKEKDEYNQIISTIKKMMASENRSKKGL